MTAALSMKDAGARLEAALPGSIEEITDSGIAVHTNLLHDAARFFRDTPGLEFDYLTCLTAVDYVDYLEVVYQLVSTRHNHSVRLKARCYQRESPSVRSVVDLWKGADFQEREVYDLMGITFEGHPNMNRLFLWEGFQGHPLRKDYL